MGTRRETLDADRAEQQSKLTAPDWRIRAGASSGQKQADAGLVKAGNTGLRIVLVQAAQRLINFSPHWRKFAARLKQKGKRTT